MILDLMRNDIARVSDAGSVRVDAPFAIEPIPPCIKWSRP
jgi:para-aminobenzoate synthetase/4-amino-4-deoxychorismate lyase